LRKSRIVPVRTRPTQVWHTPIRQPEGHLDPGLFAGHQHRGAGRAVRLHVAAGEADGASLAAGVRTADGGREPLDV
jgi:hypothetical protein